MDRVFVRSSGRVWYRPRGTPLGQFTFVTKLPNVNTGAIDGAPAISTDGLTLYFASNRSGGLGRNDLYQATRLTVNDPFGDVRPLGPDINCPAVEFFPTISFDGLALYFTSDRTGRQGSFDIYQATRPTVNDPFGDVMNLRGINTAFDDSPGHITPDDLTLYFDSNRRDGEGRRDIYMATRKTLNDPFANVTNLGSGINGPTDDVGASVSSDGLIMFFSDQFSLPSILVG